MGTASDHFRLTICDNVSNAAERASVEYTELIAEFETADSEAVTILVEDNHPPDPPEKSAMRLNKRQVGNLLAFLTTLHPLMNDEC